MNKRWISLAACGAIAAVTVCGFAACGPKEKEVIQVWGPGHEQTFIEGRLKAYQEAYEAATEEEYPYEIKFTDVGEDSAESKFANNAEACADVYHFASNMLMSLMSRAGLARLPSAEESRIRESELADVVEACEVGTGENAHLYAYPYTSDNGYCLFYDTDVITVDENTTIMDVIDACKAAGKQFIMPLTDGFYAASFIYGLGAEYNATYDEKGHFLSSSCNFGEQIPGSEYTYGQLGGEMLARLLSMSRDATGPDGIGDYRDTVIAGGNTEVNKAITSHEAGKEFGAAITGTWETYIIEANDLGTHYSAHALPKWKSEVDGQLHDWSAFIGYKLVGVNTYSKHLEEAHKIAAFLTSEESQTLHFENFFVGPANKKASEAALKDPKGIAYRAMNAQREHSVPQTSRPAAYWSSVQSFAEDLTNYFSSQKSDTLTNIEWLRQRAMALQTELTKSSQT